MHNIVGFSKETSYELFMNYSFIASIHYLKKIRGLYWKQDEWWGGAKMNGIHGEVLMWGFLAPTQLSALFWHCCCSSRIGVAKEEEVRMNGMKRSEQILEDWMFTSSVFVAVLWLKSPDPSGQLPHRHILAISPLQGFKYVSDLSRIWFSKFAIQHSARCTRWHCTIKAVVWGFVHLLHCFVNDLSFQSGSCKYSR